MGATLFRCWDTFVSPSLIVEMAGITRTGPNCLLIICLVLLPRQADVGGSTVVAGTRSSSGPTHTLMGVAGGVILSGGAAVFLEWQQPILETENNSLLIVDPLQVPLVFCILSSPTQLLCGILSLPQLSNLLYQLLNIPLCTETFPCSGTCIIFSIALFMYPIPLPCCASNNKNINP